MKGWQKKTRECNYSFLPLGLENFQESPFYTLQGRKIELSTFVNILLFKADVYLRFRK